MRAKDEPDDPWAGLREAVWRVWLESDRTFGTRFVLAFLPAEFAGATLYRVRKCMREHEAGLSVGRTGSCHGNAVAESFFAMLKNNMYSPKKWQTREDARNAAIHFIERRYNRHRPHSTIGNKAPGEVMDAFFERAKPVEVAVERQGCVEKSAA